MGCGQKTALSEKWILGLRRGRQFREGLSAAYRELLDRLAAMRGVRPAIARPRNF
jgi:hypothetical protein